MLTDGIILLDGTAATNFQLESGTSLPTSGQNIGEMFYLTGGASQGIFVYSGTAWVAVGSGVGGGSAQSSAYDIGMTVGGQPTTGEVLLYFPAPAACFITSSAVGSSAACEIAPTGEAIFSLRKNSVEFGTITFAAGSRVGAFTITDTSFVAGDVLSVVLSTDFDDTFSDIGAVISLTLI